MQIPYTKTFAKSRYSLTFIILLLVVHYTVIHVKMHACISVHNVHCAVFYRIYSSIKDTYIKIKAKNIALAISYDI